MILEKSKKERRTINAWLHHISLSLLLTSLRRRTHVLFQSFIGIEEEESMLASLTKSIQFEKLNRIVRGDFALAKY